LDLLKPNLEAYNRQKEVALGLEAGSLSGPNAPTAAQVMQIAAGSSNASADVELLYRDANSMVYADSTPSEEQIDRVSGYLADQDKKRRQFSRKRANEDQGDVTYINERNRVFNKKVRQQPAGLRECSPLLSRLLGITTSIPRRFAQASREARRCRALLLGSLRFRQHIHVLFYLVIDALLPALEYCVTLSK